MIECDNAHNGVPRGVAVKTRGSLMWLSLWTLKCPWKKVLIDRLNSFFKFGSNFDNTATSSNQLVPQSQVWLQILGELAEFSFEGIPLSFRIL